MKVLAIGGSLREESNTNKLVLRVAEACGVPFEFINLADLTIGPCRGCWSCIFNKGTCAIEDDMVGVNQKLMDADAVIIGSPTYCFDISGGVKSLIDRTMATYYRGIGPEANPEMPWLGQRPLSGRPYVPVVTAAGAGHDRALETLKICLGQVSRMEPAGEVAETVGVDDVDEMPEVLARAAAAGQALSEALTNSGS
jgi:multimeric flavodoxin WrbA